MKQLLSRIVLLLSVFALLVSLVGCGAAAGDAMNSAPAEKPSYDGVGGLLGEGNYPDNSKIIKTVNITAYTLKYDEVMDKLSAAMSDLGAYTASESHSNNKYSDSRTLSLTIKVPAENLETLIDLLSDECDVTSLTSNIDDVTLTYATLVSRRDTLTAELASIERLFEKAEESGSLYDLQTVEKRMTEVKTEINEINAQLSVYDNLVAYSTVYFNLYEEVTPVIEEEEEKGAFARIGEAFVTNLKDIWHGIVEIFVFLIGSIPYLILFGGIGVGIFFLYRLFKQWRKKKRTPPTPPAPKAEPQVAEEVEIEEVTEQDEKTNE